MDTFGGVVACAVVARLHGGAKMSHDSAEEQKCLFSSAEKLAHRNEFILLNNYGVPPGSSAARAMPTTSPLC